MKVMSKKVREVKARIEQEEKDRKEQEFLDSLSAEEREKYLEEKHKRQEEAWNYFTSLVRVLDKNKFKYKW